jgi:hypothetical protein
MRRSSQRVFLLLVLVQAAHSVEEYLTGLYVVFAPAAYVTGLIANDPGVGFVIGNTVFVAFGLWCYAGPVRGNWPSARGWAWLWVVIELANGILHTGLALAARAYFPGVGTAPLLFLVAAWLAVLLLRGAPLPRSATTGRSSP